MRWWRTSSGCGPGQSHAVFFSLKLNLCCSFAWVLSPLLYLHLILRQKKTASSLPSILDYIPTYRSDERHKLQLLYPRWLPPSLPPLFLTPSCFHLMSESSASGCLTSACTLSLVAAFNVVFPTVFLPITRAHTSAALPWQASVFWRLTDCGAWAGRAELERPQRAEPSLPLFVWMLLQRAVTAGEPHIDTH